MLSIWYLLGFIPTLILGIVLFLWLHTKKGRTFYYNYDFDEGPLWYVEFFTGDGYYGSDFGEVLATSRYYKAVWFIILIILSIILSLLILFITVGIVSVLGPLLYIPLFVFFSTKKDLKNKPEN